MTARRRKPDARAALLELVGADGSHDYMGADAVRHKRRVQAALNRLLRQERNALVPVIYEAAHDAVSMATCEESCQYRDAAMSLAQLIVSRVLRGTRGKR